MSYGIGITDLYYSSVPTPAVYLKARSRKPTKMVETR
jgi:hypothetical protein